MPSPRPAGHTLTLVLIALIALPMSLTSVSVALPDIGRDLHAGAASQQGAVTGFNVAFGSLMLACGSLGDLVGRRRLFSAGSGLFAAGQLVGALAPSILVLDAGRITAGVGAAAALPAGSALLASRFDGAARAKAFGAFGTTLGAGLALGPVVGGLLADSLGWRSILVLLAVLGGTASLLSPRLVEESRDPDGEGVDWWGTATFTTALAALILAIVGAPDHGWLAQRTLALGALSLVLLVAFVVIERRQARPMLDLALLGQPRFLGLCVAAMAIVIAFVPLLVTLPTLFITLRGVDASTAGFLLLPLTVPTLLVPVLAGSLKERIDVRHLVWAGLALEALGVVWLTTAPPAGALLGVAAPLVLAGIGVGIANGVLDGAAISAVPPARAGMAAGLFNTMRLGAETTAIAVAGSLVLSLTRSGLDERLPRTAGHGALAQRVTQGDLDGGGAVRAAAESAYVDAAHTTMWVLAGVCALALAVTAALLRTRRPAARPAVPSEACSTIAA